MKNYILIGPDIIHGRGVQNNLGVHSKNYGVKITPPVLIEDYTMHFTPVLNLRCYFNTQCCYILTPLVVILTLFGVMFKL